VKIPPADAARLIRMERLLSALLRYGAIFACVWIALGMALDMLGHGWPIFLGYAGVADRCCVAGIVLLISLPVLRVALTMAIFLLHKEYLFAAISAAVLVIIAVGFVIGIMSRNLGML
jgi:uncharacterized membrane protein